MGIGHVCRQVLSGRAQLLSHCFVVVPGKLVSLSQCAMLESTPMHFWITPSPSYVLEAVLHPFLPFPFLSHSSPSSFPSLLPAAAKYRAQCHPCTKRACRPLWGARVNSLSSPRQDLKPTYTHLNVKEQPENTNRVED